MPTIYDRYVPGTTNWESLKIVAGRIIQSAEGNEIQSLLLDLIARLGNSFYKDGDLISGGEVIVEGLTVTLTKASVWFRGRVRDIPAQQVLLENTDNLQTIGLIFSETTLTEDELSTLRDPATGSPNYGEPGAWRGQVTAAWALESSTQSVTAVYRFRDKQLLVIVKPTVYSQVLDVLAQRTFDESGHYKVYGFNGASAAIVGDLDNLDLEVFHGKGYVSGYPQDKPNSTHLTLPRARQFQSIEDEAIVFAGASTKQIYKLGSSPVRRITGVTAKVRTFNTGDSTNYLPIANHNLNGSDNLAQQYPSKAPVFVSIGTVQVWSGVGGTGTQYVEGTSWNLVGNAIVWVSAAPQPSSGATYYAKWIFTKSLQKGVRTKTTVTSEARTKTGSGTGSPYDSMLNSDVIRINRISNSTASGVAGSANYVQGVDYKLRNGRGSLSNSVGQVEWLAGGSHPASAAAYYVHYDYWAHTTEGEYVSYDSYSDEHEILQQDLNGGNTPDEDIADSLDLRPNGAGNSESNPVDGTEMAVDYDYFLARKDNVVLTRDGEIQLLMGVPSTQAEPPPIPEKMLHLLIIEHDPNDESPSIVPARTQRLTMQELQYYGQRVENLEAAVSLDKLELDAQGINTGTNEKYGIFVDRFTSPIKSDVNHKDYDAALDPIKEELRLPFDSNVVVPLINSGLSTVNYPGSNGQRNDAQIVLLPWVDTVEIQQPFATTTINVNPYNTFDVLQSLILKPPSDIWHDLATAPDIIEGSRDETVINAYRADGVKLFTHMWGFHKIFHRGDRFNLKKNDIPQQNSKFPNFRITEEPDPQVASHMELIGSNVISHEIIPYMRNPPAALNGTGAAGIVVKGSFFGPLQDNISASFDGKPVALTAISPTVAGTITGTVKADANGEFTARFDVPPLTRTGLKEVEVSANVGAGTIRGKATYWAQGVVETVQNTYQSVTTYTYDVIGRFCPIAQSFTPSKDGFISSVDIFFATKAIGAGARGVQVQVRNMVNGYPGTNVLAKQNVSAASVVVPSGGLVEGMADSAARTRVVFDDPPYVLNGQDYCIAILSDVDDYTAYVAELGHTDIQTQQPVGRQPSNGVLFLSSNNVTWTPEQRFDLKFAINYCGFTSNTGDLVFQNATGLSAHALALVVTQLLPPDTDILWSYSVDNGATFRSIVPYVDNTLETIVGQVLLKANLKGTGISPVLNSRHLGFYYYANKMTGKHVTTTMSTALPFTKIKCLVQVSKSPSGSTFLLEYSLDGGTTWVAMTENPDSLHARIDVDSEFEERYYGNTVASSSTVKWRISLSTPSQALTPRVRRFRGIVHA